MAAENRADLRKYIRGIMMAWPKDILTLSSAISSASATSISVAAVTDVAAKDIIEIDSEVIRVVSVSGTTLTVRRGERGTTAATHLVTATVNVYSWWEWTNAEINDMINAAIDFCYPAIWYPKYYENTVLADSKEFGLPSGVSYPGGERVIELEFKDDAGVYTKSYTWKQSNDRIILDNELDAERSCRILTHGKHARLTDDTTVMFSSDCVETIKQFVCHQMLQRLLANRSRYIDYAASLNDRASTPDELNRLAYSYYNQAILARDEASRPSMSGFASVRRT